MLSLSIPLLGLVAIALLAIYKLIIHPTFVGPLSKVPSAHWSSPISPVWILWARYYGRENRAVHAAHLRHGPVVRLGPNELSVNDVGGLRTVYAGGFEKGDWYSIFDNYGVPCMFSTWHSRTHSVRKRMMSNAYSKSYIHSSPGLAKQAQAILYDRLLPILDEASRSPEASKGVDILSIWNGATMDFIMAYLFGLKNGSNFLQDETYRRHWLSLYHNRKTHTFYGQEVPRFNNFLEKLGINLTPLWVNDANNELEAWCRERCDATREFLRTTPKEKIDPVDDPVVYTTVMAGISKEEKSKGDSSVLSDTILKYKDESIASEMLDHLAAGHETSGITLTYLAWHLSKDLKLQDALRAELLTLSPNMLLSPTASSTPNNKGNALPNSRALDTLPLLHAIIMETLRVNAPIQGGQPRMTPNPPCALGPYTDIPGGVRISSQAYSLHRSEEAFPDATRWDYTRWMDGDGSGNGKGGNGYTEEQRRQRDRWFWAFSSGGRMCVGSNFAMHELKLIIAAVYSNFRTYVADDEGIEQEDGYTCGPISNKLFLRFERVGEAGSRSVRGK